MIYHLLLLVSLCCIEAFFSVFSSSPKKERFLKVLFMGLMLFLFAALRKEIVGTDVMGYWKNFVKDANWTFSEIINAGPNHPQSRDPFFHCFMHILSWFSKDPQIMLVFIGFMVAFGFSVFVYYQKGNVLLLYILFVTLRIFPFTLSGLRQALAMGFLFLAFAALQNRKNLLFVLFTVIGGLFHESAYVFLLALPLFKFKSAMVVGVSTMAFAFINLASQNRLVAAVAAKLFGGRFAEYANTAIGADFEGGATLLLYVMLFAIILLFYSVLKESYQDTGALFRLASTAMMFFLIGVSMPNMFRLAYYFVFALLAFIPRLVERMFEPRMRIVIVSLIVLLMGGQYILLGPSAGIENYVFYWQ